jgi:hypothetical protein
MNYFIDSIKQDLSVGNLLKDNRNNLPLLASLFALCSALNHIYAALTNRDSMGVLLGMKQIVLVVLISCLKTGQLGLKSITDITKLLGTLF